MLMSPSVRSIVSVTIGHGTSLMAPSNSMNKMTRPLRTRPDQSASFETGAVSAILGMAWSLTLLVCTFIARPLGIGDAQFKDERGGRDTTRGDSISAFRRGALRRKWVVSFRVSISVANSPPTQSTLGNGTAAGVFGLPELGIGHGTRVSAG